MSDTDTLVTAPEAPPAPSAPETEQPAPLAVPELETDAPDATEEPEATVETYQSRRDALLAENEDWKAAHEEEVESLKKEGFEAAQKRLHPLYEKIRQNTERYLNIGNEALASTNAMLQAFKKAEESGYAEPGELGQAVAQHAPKLAEALSGWTEAKAKLDGQDFAYYHLGQYAEAPEVAEDFRGQLRQAHLRNAADDEYKMLLENYFDKLVEAREKKADDRGYRRGLKEAGGAVAKVTKADQREGAGPDTARGAVSNVVHDAKWAETAPIEEVIAERQRQRAAGG